VVSWEPPHRYDASYQGTTLAGPYRLIKNPGFTPFCLFLFADNLNELDFTLLKTFSLGESRRLEFRGEFFNLAKSPHLRRAFHQYQLGIRRAGECDAE
jgi:hypothetical protein